MLERRTPVGAGPSHCLCFTPRFMTPFSCSRFLTAGLVLSGAAFAQGDECATAATLPFDAMVAFDTTAATVSAPDFSCAVSGGDFASEDVWFTFTSVANYLATVTTCDIANYDTKIEVYEGSCGALVSVACNDDTNGCAGYTSFVEFPATNGTQYFVRIGGWRLGDVGTGNVLLLGPPAPPYECVDAEAILVDVPTNFDTTNATVSSPDFGCSAGSGSFASQDVWFKFTADVAYSATATTCGMANYDTKIEVYEGTCGALLLLACNDDLHGCSGFSSEVEFTTVSGREYFVRVGGSGASDAGTGQLLVTGPVTGPPNDECVGAIEIASGASVAFDTTLATPSVGAPARSCGGSGEPVDIWYRFLALADGPASASTCDMASFDTVLEVYSGDCSSLVSVGCNDDGPGCAGFSSEAQFNVAAGTTYFLRVSGYNVLTGSGDLVVTYPDAVANDDCSGALPIGIGKTLYSNVGAAGSGVDMGCIASGELSDVWFSYTALDDGAITIDLSGSSYDTGAAVWEGDCATLTQVDCDDDGGVGIASLLSFQATAGTTYSIQVGGFNGSSGDGVIHLTEDVGTVVCLGNVNSTGVGAVLKASGSRAVVDNDLTLNVSNLPLNQFLLFVNSRDTIHIANPGGSQGDLCIGGLSLGRHNADITNSGPTGTASLALDLTSVPTNVNLAAVAAGETWYWQAWFRDIGYGGVPTSNLSSAIGITFD